MKCYSIREVALQTGLNPHTLRYYERMGLMSTVARSANGHRRYSQADVDWLEFLKRLRATGMPITEMKQFARLRQAGKSSLAKRQHLLKEHHARVQSHINDLVENQQAIEAKLKRLESQKEDTDE